MMKFGVFITALIFLLGLTVLSGCVTTPSQSKDLQAHTRDVRGYDFETLNAPSSIGRLFMDRWLESGAFCGHESHAGWRSGYHKGF